MTQVADTSLPIEDTNSAKQSSSLRKIASNMSSLIASDVINRVTSFVIYALVGRYLGAFAFGQMSLALSMFYTFQVFAIAGLKTLITREIAKDPKLTDKYLVNGSVIVIGSTLFSLVGLFIFMRIMGYDQTPGLYVSLEDIKSGVGWFNAWVNQANTAHIILIVCLGLMPFALASICEAVFQGREQMTYIAYVNGPANIIRIVLILILTINGTSLYPIAILMFVSHVFVMIAEWYFMLRHITVPKLQFDLRFAVQQVKKSLTFLSIDALIAVFASTYLILISKFINEAAVGLFSSATQLVTPLVILYQSIVLSVFPIMCQRFDKDNPSGMKRISNTLLEILLILAIPMTVGVFAFAEWGLVFVYGKEQFAEAGEAVRLMALVVLMQSITAVLGRVLVASMRERVTLRIVAVNLVISLVLGIYFIPRYGIFGAAFASLLAMFVDLAQHYFPVAKMLNGVPLINLSWRPTLAAGIMAAFLYIMKDQNEILTIGLAIGVYFIALAILMIITVGSPQKIRAKYLGTV